MSLWFAQHGSGAAPDPADQAMAEARAAIQAKDYQRAVGACTRAVEARPDWAEAFYWRAVAQMFLRNDEPGIADFSTAIRLDPKEERYYVDRAAAYMGLRGREAEAIQDLSTALALKPGSYPARYNRGIAYYQMGEFDRSIRDFSDLMAAFPSDPMNLAARRNRAVVYGAQGLHEKAIEELDEVLRVDPRNGLARLNRVAQFLENGDVEKALVDSEVFVEQFPESSEAYCARGAAYLAKRDYDKALPDFDKALFLEPKSAKAQYFRAMTHAKLGRQAAAIRDFTAAIALDDHYVAAYRGRAGALETSGEVDAAVADLDHAIALGPKDWRSWSVRGQFRFRRGQFHLAVSDFSKAAELDVTRDGLPYRQVWLFLARERAGRDGKADLAAFRKSREGGDWPVPVIDMFLGTTSVADCLGAAKDADAQRDKEKKCEAFYFVGELHILAGERKQGVEFFQKCIDTGLSGFIEYEGAKAELDRLK